MIKWVLTIASAAGAGLAAAYGGIAGGAAVLVVWVGLLVWAGVRVWRLRRRPVPAEQLGAADRGTLAAATATRDTDSI